MPNRQQRVAGCIELAPLIGLVLAVNGLVYWIRPGWELVEGATGVIDTGLETLDECAVGVCTYTEGE